MRKPDPYNKLLVGLIPGLILPVISFLIIWKATYSGSLGEYFSRFHQLHKLGSLISLSSLSNLLLFFIFIWLNKYNSARGVIFATLIMALVMLIFKYF